MFVLIGSLVSCTRGSSSLKRLQNLERAETGFAIYRSDQPEAANAQQICDLGVSRIFALNGRGTEYAGELAKKCPSSKLVYDQTQEPSIAVTSEFLKLFDEQVAVAKSNHQTILFHCTCGCHRTGRLAAYYRMKYQGWTPEAAIAEMQKIGDEMDAHPYLNGQVLALYDYIQGRACTQSADKCVQGTITK